MAVALFNTVLGFGKWDQHDDGPQTVMAADDERSLGLTMGCLYAVAGVFNLAVAPYGLAKSHSWD